MRRYFLAMLTIVLLATAPVEAQSPAAIPDTPAGRFVSVWLSAYNSADPKELERYNALYSRKSPPQVWIDLHLMTGRLTPMRVESRNPNELTVLFSAEIGDAFWQNVVKIDPANPMKVVDAGLGTADRPPEYAIPRLSQAELNRTMTGKIVRDAVADRFAGTIMASRHGRLVFQGAFGFADRAARTPVTMDTRFRIGSANKMFTAVGTLQLVEKGALALDAPIGTYLKDYPNAAFAKTVTIRQLLSHTGGAGDIFTPEYEAKRQQVRTLADYVTLFGDRAPDISAEGKNAYANYGFVLLGRIIEVVSGEDYYRYVQRRIFTPAGMTSTGSLPETVVVPNRSRGYLRKDGKLADNADTLPYRGSAAGGGYTTAADLIRFGNALRSSKLLSKAMLAQATSPQRPDGWYGFGFFVGGQGPTRNWGHGGGAPGMNAAFRIYPELDAVVVALANLDPLAADNQADFYANRMALKE
ncbi:MAG: serine hydrolase domain-containing protein [Novosphingobium sp.]|nr:serine hydrolase domain-containing protein [Novosphingobium sp.]